MANTDEDGTQEMLEDLQFLIANDDELQADLSNVCDLLLDDVASSTEAESSLETAGATATDSGNLGRPPKPRRGKPKDEVRFEVRQKQEMLQLRAEVEQLKKQLEARQTTAKRPLHDQSDDASARMWQNAARLERMEKQKTLQENEELKQAVHQQATFIEHMQKLCRKKPRLMTKDIHSQEWRSYRLAAHDSLRAAAIHAIADRQLRRMQTIFIQAGVYGATSDAFRAEIVPQPHNGTARFEFMNHIRLAAPFETVGGAAWQVFGCEIPLVLPPTITEVVEVLDSHTIYNKQADPTRRIYSNTIRKLYTEESRHVIVFRTVMEDARMPHMTKGAMENKSGWMQVARVPDDPTQCWMTMILHVDLGTLPQKTDPAMEVMASMLERFSIAHRPAVPGTFPPASSTEVVDSNAIPFLGIQSFIERDKMLVGAVAESVNDAIKAYLTGTLQSCGDMQRQG